METTNLKMNYHPPIAKGIITVFDKFIEDIQKIGIISILDRFSSQMNGKIPRNFEKALEIFSEIKEDSRTEECFQFLEFIKNIPLKEIELMAHFDKETIMTEFYSYFRKLRDLVEHKLSVPLQQWKSTKLDAMDFPEVHRKLLEELDELKKAMEKARLLRDKILPDKAAKTEEMKKQTSAANDFKSLHPFFIIKNSEEHMEKISALKLKKVQALQEQQKVAGQIFRKAPLKFMKQILDVVEETLKTKRVIEWLEEKNYSTLKDYEAKMKKEWNGFTNELEQSRNLFKTYNEKHALYLDLKREKADRERLEKREAAVRVLQTYARDYLAKKGYK